MPPSAGGDSLRGTWWVLTMAAVGMTMVAYNTTAAITILPDLRDEFDLRPTAVQWVMAMYTVSTAALLPVVGRLTDLVGKMKLYIFGLAAFGIGALAVTLADGVALLMIGRLGQGIGAACLVGNSLAVLSAATPEDRRPFVLGLWGAMIALGMGVGPIIGGLLTEYVNWRMIFISDLVMVAISIAIAIPVMRAGYVADAGSPGVRFDTLGAATLILLLGPLAYALTYGQDHGWTNPVTLAILAVAASAGLAFVLIERRKHEPLIYLRNLGVRRFLMACLGMLMVGFFLMGLLTYFNLFVQSRETFAFSPVAAGAAVLPLTGMMFVLSMAAPRLVGPHSVQWPVTIGMVAFALGCFLLADMSSDSTYGDLWWKLLICGTGFGLTMPLLPHSGLRVLPDQHVGQGSGMINTCLYFGASLGVVLGGIVSALTIRANIGGVLDALPVDSSKREALVATLAHGSASEVEHALTALDSATGATLKTALRAVQDDAFNNTMLVLAVLGVLGAILAIWLLRGPIPAPHSATGGAPSGR